VLANVKNSLLATHRVALIKSSSAAVAPALRSVLSSIARRPFSCATSRAFIGASRQWQQ